MKSFELKKPSNSYLFLLNPSPIHGIGLFSTQNMPSKMVILPDWFNVVKRKLSDIPRDFIKFCIFIDDEYVWSPINFNYLSLDNYINHSFQPNIRVNENNKLETIRNIAAGEEILVDYNQYNEPNHLKESYYIFNE